MKLHRKLYLASLSLLASSMLLALPAAAKEKTISPPTPVVLLDGQGVRDLLVEGAFWCLGVEGNSCLFTNLSLGENAGKYRYDVVGLWDEETILHEIRFANVNDDGLLCENTAIYLKGVRATDLEGNPLSQSAMDALRQELELNFSNPEVDYACFRYAYADPDRPDYLVQYEVDEQDNLLEPIYFTLSFDEGASERYSLRW